MSACKDTKNRRPTRPLRLLLGAVFLFSTALAAAPAAPLLETSTAVATAGHFQLSWSDSEAESFELQRAAGPEFRDPVTVYHGPDLATVRSGMSDGTYYYRIRAIDGGPGPWSEPLKVVVAHHPLSRAFAFFTVGGIVFLATLVLIIAGALKERRELRHG